MEIKDLENKIINADCMDILKQLPDKCIDLVLTDPPYGIGIDGLKRRFICIEKDPEYWAKSCERLKAEQAQGQLF
jgi:DNA modification methylase